ncbi:hypothetical protein HY68_37025 [Streptomyces sp. AcH 505]|uniref:hypothetical protein n=1 Tax=Streptomyces sp. AcH 505 TaxID=352211 RepID=UPI000591D9E3|nr:hypothetical protein HY68_37025 [Streptomyces sp. AcH 505]
MKTNPTTPQRRLSPLLYPAALLSLASLAWTTWSLVDLLGTGLIGATVAAGADIIWGSVIIAEARGLRVTEKPWVVPAFGWITLLIVAGFLAMHGIEKNSLAMAAAGPFLPFGAKAVWVLALADMRNPAALTDEENHALARMERGMAFEEAQHGIEMRRREMGAERHMAEVSVDFDIELMRQDKTRELMRRRTIDVTGDTDTDTPRITDAQQSRLVSDAPAAFSAKQTQQTMLTAAAHRTAALSEAADENRDAPLTRTTAAGDAAPHGDSEALHLAGMSKAAAVRAMRDADPAASAPQIVKRLAHHGVDADANYVRTVLSRINRQRAATDGGYL